jgi:hypothetical protein
VLASGVCTRVLFDLSKLVLGNLMLLSALVSSEGLLATLRSAMYKRYLLLVSLHSNLKILFIFFGTFFQSLIFLDSSS